MLSRTIHNEERSARSADRPGYVYLIRFVFFKGGDCYKIGLSAEPDKRLHGLKCVLPGYAELTHMIETDSMATAESVLHEAYERRRLPGDGEWFDLDPQDVLSIIEIREIRFSRRRKGDSPFTYDRRAVDAFRARFTSEEWKLWLRGEGT